MSDVIIRVDRLSKYYRIGVARTQHHTMRDRLSSLLKIGRPGPRAPRGEKGFWALNDVTFDVHQGDVLGVIGRNGAGKSTLLKILSRITEPTSGRAEIHGRVGSLLEVGTGFHPELTGRENVFLNGAILGMRKSEIERKFDEIVAFAEVEKFIDTPVKRYSSGMYVRLAFAVAAHLEPEILIVDEVLAVGDASFQKKCLGKMHDVAGEGRTVLFVSHSMGAVASLCSRAILLDAGSVVKYGAVADVAAHYQAGLHAAVADNSDLGNAKRFGTGKALFTSLKITPLDRDGMPQPFLYSGHDLLVETTIRGIVDISCANVCVVLYDASGYRLVDVHTATQGTFLSLKGGEEAHVCFHLKELLLKPDNYLLGLWIGRGGIENIDGITHAASIAVEADPASLMHTESFPGPYQCRFDHTIEIVDTVDEERCAVV
jgi:lipopolysaccharide transport system ATP-binding protein